MKCKKCGLEKPLEQFIKNNQCKGGYAGTCKECSNLYSREWKRKNKQRLSKKRREQYAKTEAIETKKRVEKRKQLYPLRFRCQMLRTGMADRAKRKKMKFDGDFFTTIYLMDRLTKNPKCECCGKQLDVDFKEDKKFNDNSPSMDRVNSLKGYTKDNVAILCWRCNKHKQDATAEELRRIADFMDSWGNEVESDITL